MPRTRQPQPRARTHEDFAAITITVVVERARVDEAMRAAADAAANISGALSTQVSPICPLLRPRPLARQHPTCKRRLIDGVDM